MQNFTFTVFLWKLWCVSWCWCSMLVTEKQIHAEENAFAFGLWHLELTSNWFSCISNSRFVLENSKWLSTVDLKSRVVTNAAKITKVCLLLFGLTLNGFDGSFKPELSFKTHAHHFSIMFAFRVTKLSLSLRSTIVVCNWRLPTACCHACYCFSCEKCHQALCIIQHSHLSHMGFIGT